MTEPLDHAEFSRWRAQADGARRAAGSAHENGQHDWACFLYEQAAQLAVKGLLHGCGLDGWGHDLVTLNTRLGEHLGETWPAHLAEPAARLSRHYIATRYPDAHASGAPGDHYTRADANEAQNDATAVLDAIDGAWSVMFGEEGS